MDDNKTTPPPRVRHLDAQDAATTLLDHQHISILGIRGNSAHQLFFELCASLIPPDQLCSVVVSVKSVRLAPETVYWNSAPVASEPAVTFLFVNDRPENRAHLEHLLREPFPANPNDSLPTVLTLPPAHTQYDLALFCLESIATGHATNASAN